MSEVDDFLAETMPRQLRAEEAIHNGDPTLRLDMWSTRDPVTLLGAAGVAKSGREGVSETFRWIASRFSNCESYGFELLAAGVSGIWLTRSATSTLCARSTAARSSRGPCA